jgi:Intracellular proteinase inhibitor
VSISATWVLIVGAALAQPSVGCRPDSAAQAAGDRESVSQGTRSGMAAPPAESLRLEIDVAPQARAGEPVPITLRARNAGPKPLELQLRGRTVTFDITIARARGAIVWRRLEGQTVPAILQVWELAPGESLEVRHEWDQRSNDGVPVGPGLYEVHGSLLMAGPRPLESPAAPLRIL